MDHPAHLGFLVGGDPGIPDHLVAGDCEKVDRVLERLALVELELQVQRLGGFTGPPQGVDGRTIAAIEASPSEHVPASHAPRA